MKSIRRQLLERLIGDPAAWAQTKDDARFVVSELRKQPRRLPAVIWASVFGSSDTSCTDRKVGE